MGRGKHAASKARPRGGKGAETPAARGRGGRLLRWGLVLGLLLPWVVWDNGSLYPYFDAKYAIWSAGGALLALGWLVRGGPKSRWTWLDTVWALWLGWSAFSLVILPNPRIGVVDLGQRLAVALAYPLVRFLPAEGDRPGRWLAWVVALGLQIEAAACIVQMLASHAGILTPEESQSVYGTLGFHTFVGAFLVTGLPLLAWLWTGSRRGSRRFILALVAQVIVVLFAIQSRGAWIALAGSCVILAWRSGLFKSAWSSRRLRWAVMSGLLLLVLLPAAVLVASRNAPGGMWGRTVEDLNRHDLSGRKLVWLTALHMASRAPFVGNGLGSFYYGYIPEQGTVLEGFPQADSMQAKETVLWAHDEFLQEAAEGGGVGFFLLAILLGGSWWTAIRLPSNRPEGAALAASLAAWCVMALVDFPLHRPAESLLLFLVLGLVGRQREVSIQGDEAGRAIPARLLAGVSLTAFLVALIVTGGQFLARRTLRAALEANAAGNPARAGILFSRSIHQAPNPGQELAAYGAFLCKQGNTQEGLRAMQEALGSFRDINLYENLGSAYTQAGETRKAVTMYRLAADAGIRYPLDSMLAAKSEWSMGEERKAMAELDALHRAAPRNIAVALFLGARYLDAGQYDACLATVKPALSKGDPNLANLQAAALLRLGKWPQARRCLTDLLETRPDYAPAWTNLGVLDLLEGRQDGAREDFRKALGREPDSKVVHFYLGKWDSLPRGLAALGPAELPLDVPSVPITGYVVTDSTLVPM